MNSILKQAREVYKNREEEYYLETIRKTADELERIITQQEKVTKLLRLYREKSDLLVQIANGKYLQDDYMKLLVKIEQLEKELGESK